MYRWITFFRVNGHLGPILLTAFPALMSRQQGAETVLTGLLPDVAALYGILAEFEALGLDLLEVRKIHESREYRDITSLSATAAPRPRASGLVHP